MVLGATFLHHGFVEVCFNVICNDRKDCTASLCNNYIYCTWFSQFSWVEDTPYVTPHSWTPGSLERERQRLAAEVARVFQEGKKLEQTPGSSQ